jgi:hypothetical protein
MSHIHVLNHGLLGVRSLWRLWKTLAMAKEAMEPQGFSGSKIVFFHSFPSRHCVEK